MGLLEGDFGVMIARDQFEQSQTEFEYRSLQSVTMHELGHALSIGWADDAPIPYIGSLSGDQAYEVYSGNDNSDITGGVDETPESGVVNGPPASDDWSIMARGPADDAGGVTAETPRLIFSIEELSTVDTESVPSVSD